MVLEAVNGPLFTYIALTFNMQDFRVSFIFCVQTTVLYPQFNIHVAVFYSSFIAAVFHSYNNTIMLIDKGLFYPRRVRISRMAINLPEKSSNLHSPSSHHLQKFWKTYNFCHKFPKQSKYETRIIDTYIGTQMRIIYIYWILQIPSIFGSVIIELVWFTINISK